MTNFGIALLFALFGLSTTYAHADELSPERRAGIERLLETTHALALGEQMSQSMIHLMTQSIKAQHPDIPQKVFDALPEEVNAVVIEHLPELKEKIIGVYASHFTGEDVDGLVAFYSTALGKKMIEVMPALLQESIGLGAQWGRALGPEIAQRLRDRFKNENIDL